MSARIRNGVTVARSVARVAKEREITFLAASLSYYTFVSLIPLLVTAVIAAAFVGGDAFRESVLDLAGRYLLPTARDQVEAIISDTAASGSVGVVGFAISTWGGLKIFRAVDTAFSRVYESDPGGLVDQVKDGVVALGAIGVGIAGIFALGLAVALLQIPFLTLLSPLLLLATLMAAFFPLYYVFPDTDVTPREVLPGTVFAAVGWTVLGAIFGVYAEASATTAYGVLGAVLLLVTWFYFGGSLLLLGAVVNVVLGGREIPQLAGLTGPSDVTPDRPDRQVQQGGVRERKRMATDETDARAERRTPAGAPDLSELEARVARLQANMEEFEENIESRTVDKPEVEAELKRYVRKRMRRGHARGWGPYLVLLYGTVMTLGAFYWLEGWIAIAAMLVVFLSTLGLYMVFLMFSAGVGALMKTGKVTDLVNKVR